MNLNLTPILIVAIVMFALVMKAKYRVDRRSHGPALEDQAENARLRDEVKQLKDRIHVLERIAVDKENSLSREIEDLRDR